MKKELIIFLVVVVLTIAGIIYAAGEEKMDLVIFAASVVFGSFIVRKIIRKQVSCVTSEELERTGVLKAILDKDIENEDTTIGERIEEFEDKLEYIDIADDRKEKYKE